MQASRLDNLSKFDRLQRIRRCPPLDQGESQQVWSDGTVNVTVYDD